MARVPYVTAEELAPDNRELIVSSLQPGKTRHVYAAIGNNEEVLSGVREFFGSLWSNSGLTDRQRELVILTAASEVGSAYEWHKHANIGLDAGLTREEIGAIARDDRTPFSPTEAALIAYARAVASGRVEDPHHEAIAEYFDDETIVGIATTAAGYAALGGVLDALDVEIEADETFIGWEPNR
jgi:alkylhydroperoxidase family enzyme